MLYIYSVRRIYFHLEKKIQLNTIQLMLNQKMWKKNRNYNPTKRMLMKIIP